MKKKTKFFVAIGGIATVFLAAFLMSADHIDSPNVASTDVDIADFYAFEGDNPNNTVFVATIQGPLNPGTVTEQAQFSEDVIIEINIDNTGDFIEDKVIQAVRRDSIMYFFMPETVAAADTGLSSTIYSDAMVGQVEVSSTTETLTSTNNGMSFFAGPRRDYFFFDFNRFNDVATGTVAPEGFLPPGQSSDFFEALNVLSVVVEVPNTLLGTAPAHVGGAVGITGLPPAYNVWVTTKTKQ